MQTTLASLALRRPLNVTRSASLARRWMSVRPEEKMDSPAKPQRKKVTIQHLHQMRKKGTPITMLTAYDFPTARACETHQVDMTLVGDSLAQVCLGYDSTTQLTMDEMVHHCRAVARGSKTPFLLADMPFGSYHTSTEDAVRNALRLVKEGGMEGVKIEGGGADVVEVVRRLTSVGIPVMAHIGLLPQQHTMSSGYKVQGKDAQSAARLFDSALALEEAGAFALLLEAMPHVLAAYITSHLRRIPTIGIGAGSQTSGQVLVWDDLHGTWGGHKAKFVRRFGDVRGEVDKGIKAYMQAVRERSFPAAEESYEMPVEEWQKFLGRVEPSMSDQASTAA